MPSGRLCRHCEWPETEDKYWLRDPSLSVETGGQTWQLRENRLRQLCQQQETEKEQHFLLFHSLYEDIILYQNKTQTKFNIYFWEKKSGVVIEAAKYVKTCHSLRENQHDTRNFTELLQNLPLSGQFLLCFPTVLTINIMFYLIISCLYSLFCWLYWVFFREHTQKRFTYKYATDTITLIAGCKCYKNWYERAKTSQGQEKH